MNDHVGQQFDKINKAITEKKKGRERRGGNTVPENKSVWIGRNNGGKTYDGYRKGVNEDGGSLLFKAPD